VNGLESRMKSATHVLWTTGGALLPFEEHRKYLARAPHSSSTHPAPPGLWRGRGPRPLLAHLIAP
jgi:hypothetical protein